MTSQVDSLYQAIDRELGVLTEEVENPVTTAMTSTATIFLRNNSRRLAFIVINLGTEDVFIRPNGIPTVTTGIPIPRNGGSIILNYKDDYGLVGKEWQGITGSGAVTIFTLEVNVSPGTVVGRG